MRLQFNPYPFQLEADAAIESALAECDRTGIYVATGCGKTEIAAINMSRQEGGVLFVTPRRDLVTQTADRLRKRGIPCGIEMAEQRSDERITVACYDSLQSRKRYQRFLSAVKRVYVDEMHLNYSTRALEMLAEFRSFGAQVVGMTATPPTKKNDDLVISEHFGEPAYVYSYLEGLRDGFLAPCRMFLAVLEDLDLSSFRKSLGDLNQVRVDKLMRTRENVAAVGAMVAKHWEDEPSVLFASSIAQAELIREDILARGIRSSIIHSRMEPVEQRLHMSEFLAGDVRMIINVGILTVGWDCPEIRSLYIARCTSSPCLYGQIFGRGPRLLPGTIQGLHTAEERRAAIAASKKPHFNVYDITDSSRRNDVCSAMDVLYPDANDRILQRARRRMATGGVMPEEVDAILEDERRAAAAEQEARDRMALADRWAIPVTGQVRTYERDPLAAAEQRPKSKRVIREYHWMPYGRYRGKKFRNIPSDYLHAILPHVKDDTLRRSISRYLSKYSNNETYTQKRFA